MRNVTEKRWVRLLALALFFLFTAGAAVSINLYGYALEDGWYSREDFTFADTRMARIFVMDALGFVANNLKWLGEPGDDSLGGYGGEAFSYIVRDADTEEVYADTTSDASRLVTAYTEPVYVEAADKTVTLTGYVDLPVKPYGGCYREYYIFSQLYPLRSAYLPMAVAFALLAAAVFAVAVTGAVRLGRRGALTALGRLPFDGALVGFFIGTVLLVPFIFDHIALNLRTAVRQLGFHENWLHNVFLLWSFSLLALILLNQLTAGAFTKRLLLRRSLREKTLKVLAISAFALHFVVVLLLFLSSFGYYVFVDLLSQLFNIDPGYLVFFLVMFDCLMLPCMVQWNKEKDRICKASGALASGDLSYKVDEDRLHLVWHDLGRDLNSIGGGMAVAVEERLRSERLKTELITNVSHDLKTPLTSIINYIELLKDESLPEQTRREYLDVLDRQSAKLKKLTEDVVEASKAASGVMAVDAEPFNVAELLEQSVGEYSERLTAEGVQPVIHTPEGETCILADARLLGRVLDNLITNIIKYAQPGTRAYFDLTAESGRTVIAAKNTSRAPLDIPAEELMERFVRGDSSRSTEGSGLGLSIARSLTELMGGELKLTLDGDLFKAEIVFPTVPVPPAADASAAEAPVPVPDMT